MDFVLLVTYLNLSNVRPRFHKILYEVEFYSNAQPHIYFPGRSILVVDLFSLFAFITYITDDILFL